MIIAVDGPTSSGLGEANVRFRPIADISRSDRVPPPAIAAKLSSKRAFSPFRPGVSQ